MEKLKNIINPGSTKDDEVMYGTGQSNDPTHNGSALAGNQYDNQSGRGTQFDSGRTSEHDALSSSSNPTSGTSGLGSSTGTSGLGGNTLDEPRSTSTNPRGVGHDAHGTSGLGSNTHNNPLSTSTNPTGRSQYSTGDASARGTHGLSEPYASRMPGGFDDDAATTASVRSGVPGQTTHTGSSMTGTHDPSLTDKPLPHQPATSGSGMTGSGSNLPGAPSSTSGSYPGRTVGSSGLDSQTTGSSHLGRDAALGAGAIGAGTAASQHHGSAQRDDYAPETGRSFPLGGTSNMGRSSNNSSDQIPTHGAPGHSTAGPHSSNLANKADPRVDSDLDGSSGTGNTGSGYGSGTGALPHSGNQGSLGRDPSLGAGNGAAAGGLASGTTGYGPESWAHDHDKHGHQYEGDPCGPGGATTAGPHFVPGPHTTDTANRLDPHVAGETGSGASTIDPRGHQGHGHKKEDAAIAGGAIGAGLGAHQGSREYSDSTPATTTGHGLDSSAGTTGSGLGARQGSRDYPSSTSATSTGHGLGSSEPSKTSHSDGPAPKTAGPHKSDLLNKLDPRVDSDLSKQRGATDSGIGSSTSGSSHHHGQTGSAPTGTGLTGAAPYGDRQPHHGHEGVGTTSGLGSSNQYSGSGVDPSADTGRSGLGNTTDNTTGHGTDRHLGRDTALGAGAGAGVGGLAYEAGRHHGGSSQPSSVPPNNTGSAYDNTRGSSGYDQAGTQLAGSGQQPLTSHKTSHGREAALGSGAGAHGADVPHHKDHSTLGSTPQGQFAGSSPQSGRDHTLGRDAAIGGTALGAGAAGAAGMSEHQNRHDTGRIHLGANTRDHQQPSASAAGYPSSGYGNERDLPHDTSKHGHRKEEALAGGAAAGGLAAHQSSTHDQKALEKEHEKEMKQHDKAVAKEEKALEKDEKHHEKERAKHMAAIEKDQKKHEHDTKKAEHDAKKHEHDGEKKHGGLLGFLHKDKTEKNVDPTHEKDPIAHDRRGVDDGRSANTGAGSYDQPGQYGSQTGVQDPSVGNTGSSGTGSGITTHDAYGTQEGHNKLHKDPPAKVLEQRGQDYQGHSNVK